MSSDLPGYTLFRCDREGRVGGGVGLFLRNSLSGDCLASYTNSVVQLLLVKIHQLDTVVAVMYRPPDTRQAELAPALACMESALSALPAPLPSIILCGDFNFPGSVVTWHRDEDEGFLLPRVAAHREDAAPEGKQDRLQAEKVLNLCEKWGMTQQVEEATHEVETLDLVFTSNPDMVTHHW